ncbi:MAG: WecB/TagA/CpsF family glycosyltransferase, partial [Candidatus Hydrogenedentes bacterium]|nr:WecB/TagA/CpsF family glycosyltransferase [Candidatus Hydrogenedentota bacterium]
DKKYKQLFKSLNDVDFIFIGMGTPRTERIIDMASRYCPSAIAWGIGGGTIRIYAGSLIEASPFWRRNGLQWLHRLATDPVHLWRRYLFGNPAFIVRALRHGLKPSRNLRDKGVSNIPAYRSDTTVLRKVLPNVNTSNS